MIALVVVVVAAASAAAAVDIVAVVDTSQVFHNSASHNIEWQSCGNVTRTDQRHPAD